MHQTALDSTSLRVQAEQIADAYLPNGGRPALVSDADKVQVFLAAIQDGNYRETACRVAGIAKQTLYNAIKRAEQGDEASQAFVDALEKAEALAESQTVRNVRKASESPQFWAAGMTWLERKSPEKWGRRNEDGSGPKVLVQIGVGAGDVQVQIASLSPVPRSELAEESTG
jgi:transposase-like protein